MHSTKSEILALLKRNDGSTVDEIAGALSLAPMTVRQHLTALERDDLVRSREVRRPTGRPHFRYTLTPHGHRSIADGHDRLLALIVDEAGEPSPAALNGQTPLERRARLFKLAAAALAARHRGELAALPSEPGADRIVALLRAHGGFAEWHRTPEGFEIRDFSCVYRAIVSQTGPCAWHDTFLSELLGAEIRAADPPDGESDCAACCRYIIPASVPASGGTEAAQGSRHVRY